MSLIFARHGRGKACSSSDHPGSTVQIGSNLCMSFWAITSQDLSLLSTSRLNLFLLSHNHHSFTLPASALLSPIILSCLLNSVTLSGRV
jgi:hypothetical protein